MSDIEQTRFYKDIVESFNKHEVDPAEAISVLEAYKYILLRDTLPK